MSPAIANTLTLPRRGRGRPSAAATREYETLLDAWCEAILQIASRLEFRVSSRGWCYVLEEYGLGKGEFDTAQTLINDCRKSGRLPLDICAEDGARQLDGLEQIDSASPEQEAESWFDSLRQAHRQYTPFSFWDDKDVYLVLLVEKVDLKSLFADVCREYRIPLLNGRGWTDLNSRAAMMRLFRQAERRGAQPILLYCGDFDPAGLQISDALHANFTELAGAVGWDPQHLVVNRFGLTRAFIDAQGLTWIDGLETGKGGNLADPKHDHHGMPYVQTYLREHGARKVEANALVTRPEAGRQLLRETIAAYLDVEAPEQYERSLDGTRNELRLTIRRRLTEGGTA